jgi:hypothetical protein
VRILKMCGRKVVLKMETVLKLDRDGHDHDQLLNGPSIQWSAIVSWVVN